MIVLDTHAWLWWMSAPKLLSVAARAAIEHSDELRVPAICCWEVATGVERGRIELDRDVTEWLRLALAPGNVTLAAITPAIAVEAARLGRDFHGDPGDRLIVATARVLGGGLVTKDERIRAFRKVDAIW